VLFGPWEAHVGVIWSMGGPCGCYLVHGPLGLARVGVIWSMGGPCGCFLVHGRPMWVLFGPWEAHVGVIWSMGGPCGCYLVHGGPNPEA
jgi:hypothetical protein